MQEPSIQRILNAVRRQDVTCVPEECITLEKRRNGYTQVLVGWAKHGYKPHPDHVNENGKSSVYVIPCTHKGVWYPNYFIYGRGKDGGHPELQLLLEHAIHWFPALHEALFVGEEAARLRTGSTEDREAHREFILFVWEQKSRVKLLVDGTKVKMDSPAPQSDDKKVKSAFQERGKGRKRGQTAQGNEDAAPTRKRGKTSSGGAADGRTASRAGSGDCRDIWQSNNEDQDDEEPPPDMDDKKHIIPVNDDVVRVAGRSRLMTPSTSSDDKGALENVNLMIELCKAKQALHQNRIEELQLHQKKLALEKNLRAAQMAAGVSES